MEKTLANVERLHEFRLFGDLSEAQAGDIVAMSAMRLHGRGEVIWRQGESADGFCALLSGMVRLESTSPRGQVKTWRILSEGDCFGEMALFDEKARRATATVMSDAAEVMFVDADRFWAYLRPRPTLLRNLLNHLSALVRQVDQEFSDVIFHNMNGRLVKLLMRLARRHGRDTAEGRLIEVALTHQEIANLLGATRETVSKCIGNFRRDGALAQIGPHLVITDGEKLASWIR
ncbi:MAG: Crp/Fnr family transcriptional regulator [Planctomycetes bacterium]|nr:Crp/Fnr family transcriptional regulator [Planctomycetota bacterium]